MAETSSKFCVIMAEITFYKKAASYWAKVPATVNGVLGGFGHISDIDIEGSRTFLNHLLLLQEPPGTNIALDCGAGIGRVSKELLFSYFNKVDLIEQDEKFIKTAKELICQNSVKLGTIYQSSLQNFQTDKKYDLIWCQWVVEYLYDYDLVDFLQKCSKFLTKNGLIIIKENITSTHEIEFDEEDSSVIRPYKQMLGIFDIANLQIVKSDIQADFPDDIYSVYMFALKPK